MWPSNGGYLTGEGIIDSPDIDEGRFEETVQVGDVSGKDAIGAVF